METLNIPQAPTFRRTPANIILPAVGASTCASGNQVCSGNIGTLIKNPNVNNKNKVFDCDSSKLNEDNVSKSTASLPLTPKLRTAV